MCYVNVNTESIATDEVTSKWKIVSSLLFVVSKRD